MKHPTATLILPLFATILAFTSLGCAAGEAEPKPAEPSKRVKEFLGERTMAILAKADRVEVYRLKDASAKAAEKLDGFAIVGTGKEQGKEFAQRLAAVLYDEKTYAFDSAKACEFQAGVGFRIRSDAGQVDMILCYHCNEFYLFTSDGKSKEVEHKGEDFDAARPELVKLAKLAFPDDAEIQGLKEVKN